LDFRDPLLLTQGASERDRAKPDRAALRVDTAPVARASR